MPVYFTFDNPGILQPGVYAEVYLITCSRDSVLSVPRSALTEQEGNYAVFVKVHDDAYEKRAVSLGDTDGSRVEIKSGVNAGDMVVTRGPRWSSWRHRQEKSPKDIPIIIKDRR